LKAISRISSAVERIASACAQHLPESHRPALEAVKALVSTVAEVLPAPAHANAQADAASTSSAPASHAATQQRQDPAPAGPGHLRTRDDAIGQLLSIAEFLEASEPTNPAPLLIRRAVRLMQMGFIDIVRELSPDSAAQIENITGIKTET
jgi:type VI secretion system protein ImpA